jgi:hypothetical protein
MAETKRRHWLQLHLATCIVLMFMAGGLVWANVTVRTWGDREGCGWPKTCWQRVREERLGMVFMSYSGPSEVPDTSRWDKLDLATNIGTGLGILAGTVVACEWLIRRRERRQP